jgi:Multicopper oxidase
VDREFVTLFMIFDELTGKDAGLFHTINGYIFGNLPGLIMKEGERVRWYLLAVGNERDLHTPHWHGKAVEHHNRHTDVVELLPGSTALVDMLADNSGSWLFHCQVSDHMEAGMAAIYQIYRSQPCSSPVQFISADFWRTPGKFRVTVKNVGSKPLRSILIKYDFLLGVQYRRRPYVDEGWKWNTLLRPGEESTFEMPGWLPPYADKVSAWVLFPQELDYEDGSKWTQPRDGGCFEIFWRDIEHPQLPVLPPLFVDMRSED